MYNEEKDMLKHTLEGIAENIHNLILAGVNSDNIGVFIIVDGI
jgi:hypothetical protein